MKLISNNILLASLTDTSTETDFSALKNISDNMTEIAFHIFLIIGSILLILSLAILIMAKERETYKIALRAAIMGILTTIAAPLTYFISEMDLEQQPAYNKKYYIYIMIGLIAFQFIVIGLAKKRETK